MPPTDKNAMPMRSHWANKIKNIEDQLAKLDKSDKKARKDLITKATGFPFPGDHIKAWRDLRKEMEATIKEKYKDYVLPYDNCTVYGDNPYFFNASNQMKYLFCKLRYMANVGKLILDECEPWNGLFGIKGYTLPKASQAEFDASPFPTLLSTERHPLSADEQRKRKTTMMMYYRCGNLTEEVDEVTQTIKGTFHIQGLVSQKASDSSAAKTAVKKEDSASSKSVVKKEDPPKMVESSPKRAAAAAAPPPMSLALVPPPVPVVSSSSSKIQKPKVEDSDEEEEEEYDEEDDDEEEEEYDEEDDDEEEEEYDEEDDEEEEEEEAEENDEEVNMEDEEEEEDEDNMEDEEEEEEDEDNMEDEEEEEEEDEDEDDGNAWVDKAFVQDQEDGNPLGFLANICSMTSKK